MGKSSRKKKERCSTIVLDGSKSPQNYYDSRSSQTVSMQRMPNSVYYLAVSAAVVTFLVYISSLQNTFVSFDDTLYVINNTHIRTFNMAFFRWAFFDFYAGNWHPLTWISHALDYALWGLNPLGHHLTNVILHALNTAMVVMVTIRLLSLYKRTVASNVGLWLKERGIITGVITGLLFGLHPLHVESVAWVSERKDLLCATFFLLSILAYTKYVSIIDNESARKLLQLRFLNRHYLFALGFFSLALLSKPMAVTLPFVLLLLDWYPFGRSESVREFGTAFIEKCPFIALSVISSILTMLSQESGGAMVMMEVVPLSTRVLVAIKSLIGYLWKIISPVNLIPYYPYPKDVSLFSLPYSLTIVLTVGITCICILKARKERLWLSLWAYYVVTLIPVIGIIQVGLQSMADRYSYLPSLGPFLLVGLATAWSWSRVNALKRRRTIVTLLGISIFALLSAAVIYLTFDQIGIWKDSMTLWNYVIEKEPESVPVAYNNRGLAFEKVGMFDKAIKDYDKAIALNPSYTEPYNNRGILFENMGRFDEAIEEFDKAITLDPSYSLAYNNRGVVFYNMGRFDEAMEDFDKAIALNPSYSDAYHNRELVYNSLIRRTGLR